MELRRRRFFCSAAMIALAALFVAASSLDVTARPLDEVYALSNWIDKLRAAHQPEKALPLALREIEIAERYLGPDHRETLRSYTELAVIYEDQGRYAEAEPLLRHSTEGCERSLGKDHPDTLASIINIANLVKVLGRFGEAESLVQARA